MEELDEGFTGTFLYLPDTGYESLLLRFAPKGGVIGVMVVEEGEEVRVLWVYRGDHPQRDPEDGTMVVNPLQIGQMNLIRISTGKKKIIY